MAIFDNAIEDIQTWLEKSYNKDGINKSLVFQAIMTLQQATMSDLLNKISIMDGVVTVYEEPLYTADKPNIVFQANLDTLLTAYATKAYADAGVQGAVQNLTSQLNGMDASIDSDMASLETRMTNLISTHPSQADLQALATRSDNNDSVINTALTTAKTELQQSIATKVSSSDMPTFLAPYLLKSNLPDLTPYAKKTELPDLTPYAKTTDLVPYAKTADLPSLTPYAKTTDVNAKVSALSNQYGQVMVYLTNAYCSGMTAPGAMYFLPLATAQNSIAPAPLTKWPKASGANPGYNNVVYQLPGDAYSYRLKENPVPGQVHLWRFQFHWTNKATNNANILWVQMYNPDSGFRLITSTAMTAVSTGYGFVTMQTIADNSSLDVAKGYQIGLYTSIAESGLSVYLDSILRTSLAMEVA